ncbi:hypothetical protein [Actinoplanes lobatus]|uniref:Uncharacterized protein n=1 Tax=Actinoplanes lobatus TaxID=113568 RepID=A0A7W7HCB4_9ACTN|nr:hypothetical protein [Actinoplanes lobatus]MBB4747898.1 hypothetical protein [Actinoplanes lobatus]
MRQMLAIVAVPGEAVAFWATTSKSDRLLSFSQYRVGLSSARRFT